MGAIQVVPWHMPEVTNPLDAYSRAMQIQTQGLQQQQDRERLADEQLTRQKTQRELDAQTALAGALSSNMTTNPDGTVAVNYAGATKQLVDQGYGPEALRVDNQRREDFTNAQKLLQEQVKTKGDQAARVSSWLSTIPLVDYNESDPGKLATQTQAAASGYQSALQGLVNEGLVPPDQAQQFAAVPYSPDVQGTIVQKIKAGMDQAKQAEYVNAHIKAQHDQVMNPILEDEAAAKALSAQATTAAQTMPKGEASDSGDGTIDPDVKSENQKAWDAWRNDQPAKIKKNIPQQWSPQAEMLVKRMGMTPSQEQSGEVATRRLDQTDQKITDAELKAQEQFDKIDQKINQTQQTIDFRKEQAAEKGTPESRKAQTDYDKATSAEGTLTHALETYRNAITQGDTYVQENAKGGVTTIPMDRHVSDLLKANPKLDEATAQTDAIEEMKGRANQKAQDIVGAVKTKKDFASRMGRGDEVDVVAAQQSADQNKYQLKQKKDDQGDKPQAETPPPAAAKPPAQAATQYQQTRTDNKGNQWGWSPGMTSWQQIPQH